jgi:hypothetical protein
MFRAVGIRFPLVITSFGSFFTSWCRYSVKPDNYSLLCLSRELDTSYEFGGRGHFIGIALPHDHPCTLDVKVCFGAVGQIHKRE